MFRSISGPSEVGASTVPTGLWAPTPDDRFRVAFRDAVDGVVNPRLSEKHIREIAAESNAECFDSMENYVDQGHYEINGDLRSNRDSSASTENFLRDLQNLKPYAGVAYRAVVLTPAGLYQLSQSGTKVMDKGVQSASVSLDNAREWATYEKDTASRADLRPALLVFHEDMPKKNLSTGKLLDHVVIEPNVISTFADAIERDGVLIVGLKRSESQNIAHDVLNMFDGHPLLGGLRPIIANDSISTAHPLLLAPKRLPRSEASLATDHLPVPHRPSPDVDFSDEESPPARFAAVPEASLRRASADMGSGEYLEVLPGSDSDSDYDSRIDSLDRPEPRP
jgi:hypothetical protein